MSSSTYISLPLESSSTSGVDSFNGRTGIVTSQAGDYDADQIAYDNTSSGLGAVNVQDAIDELAAQSATSASPGFSFGRSGVVMAGSYLLCETVPSNVSGRWVYLNSAYVREVFVTNENSGPFTINAYYHDGNNVNETLLGSVTVATGLGNAFTVNWPVPIDKQISMRVAPASANSVKNIVCGLELYGSV